jgi:peptide deformylase
MKILFSILFAIARIYGDFQPEESHPMQAAATESLYKVLSYRNWLTSQSSQTIKLAADDFAFIHFSKIDQLSRIIGKYWADASTYVILKIDPAKLPGDLKFEANPGGTNKYYHLYNGYIPFASVQEAKVVFQQKEAGSRPSAELALLGESVLRQKARPLSKEEILSPEIQAVIETIKGTLKANPGVGLAAPQIGKPVQIAVIEDMDHAHLTPEQLKERDRFKVPLHVIVNPKMTIEESEKAEFFEGCLSVPNLLAVVPRAKKVRVDCLDEKGNPVVIHAKGWYARILQHEIDHLNGILFCDRCQVHTLTTDENYMKLWRKKTVAEAQSNLQVTPR